MLRLDEASDPLSQISPAMIPEAAPIPGEAEENAHIEADRVAVVLAARAGYDPFGLPTVLQDLGRVTKDDSRISLLFKTHPHPDDRLTELGEAVGGRLDGIKGQTLQQRLYRIKF